MPMEEDKQPNLCTVWGEADLLHVYTNCSVARDLQHYNLQRDAVLQVIANFIQPKFPSTSSL